MNMMELNARFVLIHKDIQRAMKLAAQANKRTDRANRRLLALEKEVLSDLRSTYNASKKKGAQSETTTQ